MKYTIEGFNQIEVVKLNEQKKVEGSKSFLDCTDLVILRWFVDFYPNMKKIDIDGFSYAWLTYNKMQADLPLIPISKRSFSDRLQKLVDFGVLSHKLIKEGGTFSVYGFAKNYSLLIEKIEIKDGAEGMQSTAHGMQNLQGGVQLNNIGVCSQLHTGTAVEQQPITSNIIYNFNSEDSSIKNKSIKGYNGDTSKNASADEETSPKKSAKKEQPKPYFEDKELNDLFLDFLDMRKKMKVQNTERAVSILLAKLNAVDKETAVKMLEQSIENGWRGLFPLKEQGNRARRGESGEPKVEKSDNSDLDLDKFDSTKNILTQEEEDEMHRLEKEIMEGWEDF